MQTQKFSVRPFAYQAILRSLNVVFEPTRSKFFHDEYRKYSRLLLLLNDTNNNKAIKYSEWWQKKFFSPVNRINFAINAVSLSINLIKNDFQFRPKIFNKLLFRSKIKLNERQD